MFIMNTKSTIAVMSNSGVSLCGLRAIRSSYPVLHQAKLDWRRTVESSFSSGS